MKIHIKPDKIFYFLTLLLVSLGVLSAFLVEYSDNAYYILSFFSFVIWAMCELYKKRFSQDLLVLFFIIIFIVSINLGIAFANGDFALFVLVIIADVLFMLILNVSTFEDYSITIFLIVNMISSLVLIYSMRVNMRPYWGLSSLTIFHFNPQSIGTWSFIYFAGELLLIDAIWGNMKKKVLRIIVTIVAIYIAYELIRVSILTETRAAIAGIFILLIVRVLPKTKLINKKIFSIIVSLIPILVIITTFVFSFAGIGRNMEGGSFLNGREDKWEFYLSEVINNLLFGNIVKYNDVYTHNFYLDIVVLFGIVVLTVYIILTYKTIYCICRGEKNRLHYDAIFAFVGALILSSFEGMVFSIGCGGMYFYAFSFLVIAKKQITHISEDRGAVG